MHLKLKIDDYTFQIVNIYSPTNPLERKRFIGNPINYIDVSVATLVAGDFNWVFEYKLDSFPPGINKDQGNDELQELINISDLVEHEHRINILIHSLLLNRNLAMIFFLYPAV